MNQSLNDNEEIKNETEIKEEVKENKDYADKTIETVEKIINTKNETTKFTPDEVLKYKTDAVISYIPFVSLYYIITSKYKKSNYLHFHTNQGLSLTSCTIIIFFVTRILCSLFAVDGGFGREFVPGIIEFICYILYVTLAFLVGFGILNTTNGQSKELPLIGKYRLLK